VNTELLNQVETLLEDAYGESGGTDLRRFFSPARINLIGEHIDYCGGNVLPAAVQFGTWVVARPNNGNTVRLASLNEPERVEFDPAADLQRADPLRWGDYVKGVFAEYCKLGVELPCLDIAVGGDVPGGGMSSSASLEVGIAVMLEAFSGYRASPDEFANRQAISWLAQRAENDFVGVKCGIMDQGAVALGKQGHAMLMDCSDLSIQYIPVELGEHCLLIANTCKERRLGESAYNERRDEVEQALAILQPVFDIENLCQVAVEKLDDALACLDDPVIRKRARHVITEQHRVTEATACLACGDLVGFGHLLDASHQSLQQDFEVTGPELDTLVDIAQQQPGVLGARMMGAGFGGCGLVLLESSAVADVTRAVGAAYAENIGYEAEFYLAEIGSGAGEILVV